MSTWSSPSVNKDITYSMSLR